MASPPSIAAGPAEAGRPGAARRPLRILIAHNRYREPGGEDAVFESEAALLEDQGHEVVRYEVHNDDLDDGAPLTMARAAFWNPATFAKVDDLLGRHRPDLAHFHNTFPLMSPSVYDACRRHGVPVVQTLHNYRLACPKSVLFRDGGPCEDCLGKVVKAPAVIHACYREDRRASAVVAGISAYHHARGTYRHAVDRYIALTDFARKIFVAEGLPASRIVVKGNSVPDRGVGRGGPDALFVGRLSPEKGVDTMLEAWRHHDVPMRLKVVGDGPMRDSVVQSAAVNDRIVYLGRRGSEEVAEAMRTSAFLVFPSECYEGMPMVILEAFAAGLPVVASGGGAAATMVRAGATGWTFRSGDASDLAATVNGFAATGVPERMRRQARADYEGSYAPASNLRALESLYRSLAGGVPI